MRIISTHNIWRDGLPFHYTLLLCLVLVWNEWFTWKEEFWGKVRRYFHFSITEAEKVWWRWLQQWCSICYKIVVVFHGKQSYQSERLETFCGKYRGFSFSSNETDGNDINNLVSITAWFFLSYLQFYIEKIGEKMET